MVPGRLAMPAISLGLGVVMFFLLSDNKRNKDGSVSSQRISLEEGGGDSLSEKKEG